MIKDGIIRFKFLIATIACAVLLALDHCLWQDHGVTNLLHEARKDAYIALATTFGALLGFVITAYSIVVSLNDSTVLTRLKERNQIKGVLSVFTSSIYIIGFAAIVSLVAIFADSSKTNDNRFFEYFVFATSIWAALAVLGVVFLIEALVEAINEVEGKRAQ